MKHPEQKEDECFIGNGSDLAFRVIRWDTKRKGNIPYDWNGEVISAADLYPIFVNRSEVLKALEEHPDRKEVFLAILDN